MMQLPAFRNALSFPTTLLAYSGNVDCVRNHYE